MELDATKGGMGEGGEELQLWIIRWFAVISDRVNLLRKKLSPFHSVFLFIIVGFSFFFFFFRPNETELKRTEVNLSSYNRKKRMVSEFSIIGIELILLYKNLYTTL